MKAINYLFGEMLVTRVTKAIFYVAWLSMLPNFFHAKWHGQAWTKFSMPLFALTFFTTGLFMAAASDTALIDLWRPTSRVGRQIADPATSRITVRLQRISGIALMIFVLLAIFNVIHFTGSGNAHS